MKAALRSGKKGHRMKDYLNNEHVLNIVSVIAMVIFGLIIIKILVTLLTKTLKKSNLDPVLHIFIVNIIRVTCYILLIITVLGKLGVPTSTFVTVIAACGAAIALSLQESLGNFAGGLLILFSKPFVKGDLIQSADIEGRVQNINLLYSVLITDDNERISIPNGQLANNVIVNYTAQDRRRVKISAGISYSADIDHARDVIKEAVRRSENFLSDKDAFVGVKSLADSSVELVVVAWCQTDFFTLAEYELREIVKKALDEADVEIPFPQIVVHQAEDTAPAERILN